MSLVSRRNRRSLVAATVMLAGATSASAQTRNWDGDDIACNQGILIKCIDLSISLVDLGTGATAVTMRLQNLQSATGLGGPFAIPGWITLGAIQFSRQAVPDVGFGASASLEGGATAVNVPVVGGGGLWWGSGAANEPTGTLTRYAQPGDGAYIIAGCQTPAPTFFAGQPGVPFYQGQPGYLQTCGPNETIFLNFVYTEFAFTDATFVRMPANYGNVGYDLGMCTSGPDCPTTVTPEPGTLLLLGSGLAGLSSAGFRRRGRRAAALG